MTSTTEGLEVCGFCNENKTNTIFYPSIDGSDELDYTQGKPCCDVCEQEMIDRGDVLI